MTVITSREFNNDVAAAKRRAAAEPVVITDRGTPKFVLLSIEEFSRLRGDGRSIVEQLRMDDDIDFEPKPIELTIQDPEL